MIDVAGNCARVREQVAQAARRCGRDPQTVRIIAASKTKPFELVEQAVGAGITDVGENYVQEAADKIARISAPVVWHMIGHLQRNKVKLLLPHARIIHSLDSPRLAETIEQHAAALDALVEVLIEVNVSGEASKEGVRPDEIPPLLGTVAGCPHLRLRGLMTMAPYEPDPEAARPCFARLRSLLDRLRTAGAVGPQCSQLSMGMSQDYEVAVEEGATLVRVGSALFEGLPSSDPRGG